MIFNFTLRFVQMGWFHILFRISGETPKQKPLHCYRLRFLISIDSQSEITEACGRCGWQPAVVFHRSNFFLGTEFV